VIRSCYLLADAFSLRFESSWPVWAGVLIAVVALAAASWIYRREDLSSRQRRILVGLRLATVAICMTLIWRPALIRQRTEVIPSEVLILFDDSASTGFSDRTTGSQEAMHGSDDRTRDSRWERARKSLMTGNGASLKTLLPENHIRVFTFSGEAQPRMVIEKEEQLSDLEEFLASHRPQGGSTSLNVSVEDALASAKGRRVSAIVMVSDGRSAPSEDLDRAINVAKKRSVPIHSVMLGSPLSPRDLALGPVHAQENVFVKDIISFRSGISASGFDEPVHCTAELFAEGSDQPLDKTKVSIDANRAVFPFQLRHKPMSPGRITYQIRIRPDPEESQLLNNEIAVEVNVVDKDLRVLYVDGYPRYEYRYLKSLLIREETITVSCLLLSADEDFPQEGNEPIRRLPGTPEEFARYDVILIGDVDPHDPRISFEQMSMTADLVRDRGAGWGMIAGPRYSPTAYVGTPFETILPIVIDEQGSPPTPRTLTAPFNPVMTQEGQISSIFQITRFDSESADTFSRLPGLYWFYPVAGLKPGAEALAIHPAKETMTGPAPILALGRYGAGQTMFQAVDSTWRWRYQVGDLYFDTYWLQLIRRLSRNKVLGQGRSLILSTDQKVYDLGQSVVVSAEILDSSILGRPRDSLPVSVVDRSNVVQHDVQLRRIGSGADRYEGSFLPSAVGGLKLKITGLPIHIEGDLTESIRINQPNLERRIMSADHTALKRLSIQTGGAAVSPDELETLIDRIEDRSQVIPNDQIHRLWDTKWALIVLVVLLSAEWILRKYFNLL
jgi:hypothetical protein